MLHKTPDELKEMMGKLLAAPMPSAEEWSDVGIYWEMLWEAAQKMMRAKEILAYKKFREIRRSEKIKSRADAEIDWYDTPEYHAYKNAEDTVEGISRWVSRATNESSARKNK